MVSNDKMVQLCRRVLQFIIIFAFGLGILACAGSTQYSSIHIQSGDSGEIAFFLANVVITKIGKRLDKGYKCPVYCGVDHTHYYWDNNEIKDKKTKQPTTDGVPGHNIIAGR